MVRNTYKLTDAEVNAIVGALEVASEIYKGHASAFTKDEPPNFLRLKEQFERQARDADQLRELLADYPEVLVSYDD